MEDDERLYNFATMAAVSNTCKLFRDIISPKLYKTISSFETGRGHIVNLDLFARTIYEQPELAPLVQETSWARGSRHSPPGCSFETTGLIMRMLPGVQAVTFCLEPDARNGDWPHRPRPLRQLPEMPCPPKVSLKNRQEWGQTVSGYVYSLLETALPLLKHADGLQDLVCQYLWSELSVPLNLQNLQTTCFFRCEMSGSTLRNILAWSSNLESFLWIPGWRGCWPHQATAAIRPARERLQTLVLDFSSLTDTIDGDGPDSENPQSTPQIGSLQEFTALTSLYADTTCVYHPALVM